ncbi:MAG: hypothetical protein RIC19_05500 [Phaeodactylibacter sp.]|uniref:hypothetical protein n=1 Tax=Phaeodactylibacter sp. TaxID=1940289 RepID=UPI0032EFB6EA
MVRIKSLLFLFSLFILGSTGQSQNCFIQLDNATGQSFTSDELAQLDTAACALREVFPTEFQNDFAVYDFGFYLHQQGYEGGMPQVFQDKIAEVEQESPYFLLFGRELSNNSGLGRIWVEVSLPEEGSFICYESDYFDVLQFKVQTAVAQAFELGSAAIAEEAGIEKLTTFVQDIVECCDPGLRNSCSLCSWTYNDVIDYYDYAGFTTYDCEVTPSSNGLDSLCLCSYPYQINSNVHGLSNGEVQLSVSYSSFQLEDGTGADVNTLFDFLSSLGESYSEEGQVFFAAITDQTMFCSDSGDPSLRSGGGAGADKYALEASFAASDVGIWYSVVYTDNVAKLAVKTKGIYLEGALWLLGFCSEHHAHPDAGPYAKVIFDLKNEDYQVKYERGEELFEELLNNPSFFVNCGDPPNAISDWSDLASFVPPQNVLDKIEAQGEGWDLQRITQYSGAPSINLDYFSVLITEMPFKSASTTEKWEPQELFNYFRKNINEFVDNSNSEFHPLSFLDEALWLSDNPLETIISIDIKTPILDVSALGDDGSVICSQYQEGCCWIFSTLEAPNFPLDSDLDGYHPVSGNRQFGFIVDSNGHMTIYTKGADRLFWPINSQFGPPNNVLASKTISYVLEKIGFSGADALWSSMVQGVANFVNTPGWGGSAEVQFPIIKRPEYPGDVYQLLLQDYPIDNVSCCCD